MRRLARANVDALPVRDHRLCVAATGPGAAHRPIFCLSGGEDITKAELRSPRILGSRRGERGVFARSQFRTVWDGVMRVEPTIAEQHQTPGPERRRSHSGL